MAEYIDRVKCWDDFYSGILDVLSDDDTNDRANEIMDIFDELPTADVEPVRRAKFVHFSDVWGTCSNCGEILFDEERKFCPNCGALMDGEDGEENDIH